ncbi:MAG: [Blautia sp.]|nr:[FeFe] hydrogenase H-cluster maturation GTPase HydF [Blautia sp.]
MSNLNDTASANRLHIGFFGLRNAGKSSLVNAVTGQELAVVSDVKGTTTDPVKKAMELLPLGPVVIIDTPGLDDEGELGEKRVTRARRILAQTDLAVLVVDSTVGMQQEDLELEILFKEKKLPYLIAFNKADLMKDRVNDAENHIIAEKTDSAKKSEENAENRIYVSSLTGENVNELKERLGAFAQKLKNEKKLIGDLISPGDVVVLVIPVDESAPKGRLILPQQQTMRDILDNHGIFISCQDTELPQTLEALAKPPALVVTDSQAFGRVAKDTPADVMLTSFSILFARYKGSLEPLVRGAARLATLKNGDRVLISEGCTHHRQCNDIGTVKIPGWIRAFCKAEPEFAYSSGGDFPEDLSDYALIVHCGGCMLNEKEMSWRIGKALEAGVPIVNYGIAIAQMHGILKRSLEPFPQMLALLED